VPDVPEQWSSRDSDRSYGRKKRPPVSNSVINPTVPVFGETKIMESHDHWLSPSARIF
jgi:hypothetical protein